MASVGGKLTDCDVLVVGGGHAGCEAAAAAARLGAKTMLVSQDLHALGRMSCNPAIGGIAKGHLVREIDALGGVMPLVTDRTAIQYRVLNRSKGFAVWSPRAQCDRRLYSEEMVRVMHANPNVELQHGEVSALICRNDRCMGVKLADGSEITAGAVILTCGTFLNGIIHCGLEQQKGGRTGEPPVTGLTESIVALGIESNRLKTGTPPRLDGASIDFNLTERQDGDADPIFFSTETESQRLPHRPCFITHTNRYVHDEIRKGLDRSPLFRGIIKGIGPRYCPSIEDKVVRFSHHESHTLFLEPEGLDTDEIYPNGFATSLPVDVQIAALRMIPALKKVVITRPGYAIEYDYFPPHQLRATLETKLIRGLYFAGQINGTSGYEEAAALGLIAGVNAALAVRGDERFFTLGRDQAYIGVLIDDLITRGIDEPYRMFTSRAEFRLKLRLDNAGARLAALGYEVGLVNSRRHKKVQETEQKLQYVLKRLAELRFAESDGQQISLYEMLKRPESDIRHVLCRIGDDPELSEVFKHGGGEFARRVTAEIKYAGYIRRQDQRAEELRRNRAMCIPDDFNYTSVKGLSLEGREKMSMIKPDNLGQAANIPGITPADLAVLMIYLKR